MLGDEIDGRAHGLHGQGLIFVHLDVELLLETGHELDGLHGFCTQIRGEVVLFLDLVRLHLQYLDDDLYLIALHGFSPDSR